MLWSRDVALLPVAQQAQALAVFRIATEILGCEPYHRASKQKNGSDYQTILRHPNTGKNCLVITIAPDRDKGKDRRLRLDFFDKSAKVQMSGFLIYPAPRTQWTIKGERRVFIFAETTNLQLQELLRAVISLAE